MIKPTNVHYDSSMPIVVVRPDIWSAIMPTMWFENYCMVGVLSITLLGIKVFNIHDYYMPGDTQRSYQTRSIYSSNALQRLINANHLERYVHIVSNSSFEVANAYKVLGGFHAIARSFEDKAYIRELFGDEVPFPPHRLLAAGQAQEFGTYAKLSIELQSERLVLQHSHGSGGRGTFFVDNEEEFLAASKQLYALGTTSNKWVVSRCLENILERSLQVCVTDTKTYVGPAQAQLVRHPLLVSNKPGGAQFCGGRITTGLMSESAYAEAHGIALIIAERMRQSGYRGIFGIDFAATSDGRLYVLEVNARTTGLTSLLGSVQQNIPYQLLHILELAHAAYTVDDVAERYGSGSFILVYAQTDGYFDMESGRYDVSGSRLGEGLEMGSLLPESEADYFIATRVTPDTLVASGKAIAYIYSKTQLFDDTGALSKHAQALLGVVRGRFRQVAANT